MKRDIPRYGVKQTCLARPVGANHSQNISGFEVEVYVPE
jgi:hypothetical protein